MADMDSRTSNRGSWSRPLLPVELLTRIIGFIAYHEAEWENTWGSVHLYSDREIEAKNTLLACSAASRSLRDITIPYLFHTVAMRINFNLGEIADLGDYTYRSLDEFSELLDSCPAACHTIRELRICGAEIDNDNEVAFSLPEIGEFEIANLVKVFARLPRLCILAVRDVFLGDLTSSYTEQLHGLDTLSVLDSFHYSVHDNAWAIDPSTILPLVNCFPKVQCIWFDRFDFRPPDHLEKASSFPASLRTIKVSDCVYTEELLSLLVRDISKRSIHIQMESLELDGGSMNEIGKLSDLLVLVCHSLRSISLYHWLDLDKGEDDEDLEIQVQLLGKLSFCSKLESFTLSLGIWDHQPPFVSIIMRLSTILSFLQDCPSIREITLLIAANGQQEELSEFLTSPNFAPVEDRLLKLSSLARVKIEFTNQNNPDNAWYPAFVEEFKKANFSLLYEKGLLY